MRSGAFSSQTARQGSAHQFLRESVMRSTIAWYGSLSFGFSYGTSYTPDRFTRRKQLAEVTRIGEPYGSLRVLLFIERAGQVRSERAS